MSLQDKIAAARDAAEKSMHPADWAKLRALEAVETAERVRPPEAGDCTGLPTWSEVSQGGD